MAMASSLPLIPTKNYRRKTDRNKREPQRRIVRIRDAEGGKSKIEDTDRKKAKGSGEWPKTDIKNTTISYTSECSTTGQLHHQLVWGATISTLNW